MSEDVYIKPPSLCVRCSRLPPPHPQRVLTRPFSINNSPIPAVVTQSSLLFEYQLLVCPQRPSIAHTAISVYSRGSLVPAVTVLASHQKICFFRQQTSKAPYEHQKQPCPAPILASARETVHPSTTKSATPVKPRAPAGSCATNRPSPGVPETPGIGAAAELYPAAHTSIPESSRPPRPGSSSDKRGERG